MFTLNLSLLITQLNKDDNSYYPDALVLYLSIAFQSSMLYRQKIKFVFCILLYSGACFHILVRRCDTNFNEVLSIFYKGSTFETSCLASLHIEPLLKRCFDKRKDFANKGNHFFPFKVDPFSEGDKIIS